MILFLDFDGALHPRPTIGRSGETDLFRSLHLLEDVLRQVPDVEVVISSSWREQHHLDELREHFGEDLRERIVGTTPLPGEDIDFAPSGLVDYPRHTECVAWLSRWRPAGVPWLTIDDMAEEFAPRCQQLLLIDGDVGLDAGTSAHLLQRLKATTSDTSTELAAEDHLSKLADAAKGAAERACDPIDDALDLIEASNKRIKAMELDRRVKAGHSDGERFGGTELERIVSDRQYPGIERVMQVLAPLTDGAKLQFLLSRRGSLGGDSVLDALRSSRLDAVIGAAEAFAE